jgi:hypothetical protein
MELLSSLLLIAAALLLIVYLVLVEGLDWIGRAEIIEQKWPRLWGAMNNRPMRLVLLVVAVVMLAHVIGDLRSGAEPPLASFAAPKVPTIDTNVKVITVTSSPPHHCWLSNPFGMPNSTIKGAITATAAIVHCNYKIDAPFKVAVEFDRDFIPGGMVLTDSGIMMGGGGVKEGVYLAQVNSPALLSDQLIVVTVYGPTDQYPRGLRASVSALR